MKQVGIFLIFLISLSFSTDNQIIPDDYPVTNEMLEKYYKQSNGALFASDEVWFTNRKLDEVLILGLYTDYFRTELLDCKREFFLSFFIKHMEYSGKEGIIFDLTKEEGKVQTLKSFVANAIEIEASYFKSNQGVSLGMTKEEVIRKYGKAETETTLDNCLILKWDYKGFPRKPLNDVKERTAINSFGYHVRMYLVKGILVAVRIQNDAP
jgi:hypothetical protein